MRKQTTKNKTILVVEDEIQTLQALVDVFASEGFSILKARDGSRGLALALARHPDLILLDILIPKMDGMAMLEELRKDNWGKSVPIIILTNLTDVNKVSEALENGVYDFLVKTDWKLRDVIKRVKETLGIGQPE